MTIQEFIDFQKKYGGIESNSFPIHPFRKEWEKVYNEVKPHFFGEIPDILEKTFPNEDEEIFNYRKETYQPKTENCITESINKLSRLLQESKFTIEYQNEPFQDYIDKELKVEGSKFTDFFFKNFTPKRMLDPNAVLLACPKYNEVAVNRKLDLEFKFIDSKYIYFVDLDLGLLIYLEPAFDKYKVLQQIGTERSLIYRYGIVTDQFYGYIQQGDYDSEAEPQTKLVVTYEHKLGFVPFTILGGRTLQRDYNGYNFTYYKSDLSSAIPFLNDAAIADNQEKSTTIANCFPVKVLQGVDCHDCHGSGMVASPTPENPDAVSSCMTCKGTGQISISPLSGIYIKKKSGLDDGANDVTPLEYISPSVDTMKHLGGFAEKKYEQAREVLNIEKAVKYAQSAVAKEVDKQPEYIEVKRISDEIFTKLNYMLYVIQGLRELNTQSIVVKPPQSFDIKNEKELFEEYKETVASGAPDFVREAAFMSWIKQRFASDEMGMKIAKLCVRYAPKYLFTIQERLEQLNMMVITDIDNIKAEFAFSEIVNQYKLNPEFLDLEFEQQQQILDEALQPRFDMASRAPIQEPIAPNELDAEEEEEE